MGTINTAEIAKKNPSVYIEMVQQKAELDSIALENAKQLSLLYLETYAKENNLSEEDKAYLESVIEYRVLMEEVKNNNGIFSKIINAFKRLWEWLFGSKDKEVKPEDLNKKVAAKFDLNDAERYFGAIQGDLQKLDGCKTKADVDKNKGDIVKTVNTLKTIATTTSVISLSVGAVIGIKNKIKSANSAVTKMAEKAKQSYDEEIAKYKTDSGSSDDSSDSQSEKNKKIQELEEAQKEVAAQYQSVLDQLTTMSKEIKRLMDEGTSDSGSKSDDKDDDKNEDGEKKPVSKDVQDMLDYETGGSDGNGGGSGGNTKDEALRWINKYHYTYTENDFNSTGDKAVKVIVSQIPEKMMKNQSFKNAVKAKSNNGNDTSFRVTYNDLVDLISKYNSAYKPGIKPASPNIQISVLEDNINKIIPGISDTVLKLLYGSVPKKQEGTDFWHTDTSKWNLLGNTEVWNELTKFCKERKKDYSAGGTKFIKKIYNKDKGKFKNGCTKEQNDFLNQLANNLNDSSISQNVINTLGSQSLSGKGKEIQTAIKTSIGLSATDPDPCYFK